MTQTGVSIYRRLQQALDESRRAAQSYQHEQALLDGQINDLVAQKGAALLDLARHYLPEISRPAVESTFIEIRTTLLEVLGRKERAQAELTARSQRFVERCESLGEQLTEITNQLNESVRERERLEVVVAEKLKGDTEFQRLSQIAAQMEARLQRNEARVSELSKSAREKLPPYESSTLFQYLYRRGYGTSAYTARGTIRSLDKWVSDVIDFPKARYGYDYLKTTLKLMADEVARRQADFRKQMEQVEAIEDRYQDEVGLTRVMSLGQQQGAKRDEFVRTLEATRREQQAVDAELHQMEQAQGKFYNEAIHKFEQFLGQTETNVLQARAQRTADPRDDIIVNRIAGIVQQIDSLKPRLTQTMLARKQADDIAGGMDLVVNRFRQNNFDSERSSFAQALDISTEVQRYQQGLTKPEEFWQIIRRQQEFEPTWAENASVQGAQAAAAAIQAMNNPAVSQALVSATLQVVGTALNSVAQSGIERRAPERQVQQELRGRPPSRGRFTTGEGF